jgi:enoyl-CoA hydratase/carnithine racemase
VTIAAMHGHAIGRGLMLALACDLRIAADDLRASLPELSLGMFPGLGGTTMLKQIVGPARAAHMVLTASPVDAQTALQWGLVTEVVPRNALAERARAVAHRIGGYAPVTTRIAKSLLADRAGLRAGHERETLFSALAQSTTDWPEGLAAFKDKRAPRYIGE